MTWLVFPIGVVIATISIFTGLGGGILWVPFLISVLGIEPREAVLCALVIQVFGQGGGTFENLRRGTVDRRLLVQQLWVSAPATFVGAALTAVLDPPFIKLGLGLLTFLIVYLFLQGEGLLDSGEERADLEAGGRLRPLSAAGGFLTGFVSVGAGDLVVPAFNRVARLTMERAVATAVALMLFLSVFASASHLLLGGSIPWRVVAVAAPAVVLGGILGSRLHAVFGEARFKEVFVLLLVFLGSHVTFNAL